MRANSKIYVIVPHWLMCISGLFLTCTPNIATATDILRQIGELKLKGNAEIVAAHPNGNWLVTSNSERESIDVIAIQDAAKPKLVNSIPMPGEPTSVAISPDGNWAVAAVYAGQPEPGTGLTYISRPGILALIDMRVPEQAFLKTIASIGHHPDSIAVTQAGSELIAIVAIENEPIVLDNGLVADTDLPGEKGDVSEPGYVEIVTLQPERAATSWRHDIVRFEATKMRAAQLLFPDDPQPEFVAISPDRAQVAISLQENNGIALLSLCSKSIVNLFSLGRVNSRPADLKSDDKVRFTDRYPDDVLSKEVNAGMRFPDAIAFTPDGKHLLSADEGEIDFTGGRGFSLWTTNGELVWDDNGTVEQQAHAEKRYPDKRSANKGIEIEGIASAVIGDVPFAFAIAERGSFIVVYNISNLAAPEFVQLAATGKGPEGIVVIPERNLVIVAAEVSGSIHVYEARL